MDGHSTQPYGKIEST